MKNSTLISLSLLSLFSLTSCFMRQQEETPITPLATSKNVIYLHNEVTRTEDASATFRRYISSGNVVVDFYATWCGPCKYMSRTIDQIAAKFPNVTFLKVDTDQFPTVASGIRSIPTLVLYKNGTQVKRVSGAQDTGSFTSLLNQYY